MPFIDLNKMAVAVGLASIEADFYDCSDGRC